jgi:hypothetical protein
VIRQRLEKIDIATHVFSVLRRVTRRECECVLAMNELTRSSCVECGAFVATTKGIIERTKAFAESRGLTHEVWCKECHKQFFGDMNPDSQEPTP